MRLIDADKLYPDCMTKEGKLAISQSRLANAPTVETFTEEDMKRTIKENFDIGYEMAKNKYERPQGKWLFDKENSFTIDMFKCSICGYFGHTHFKFCPNCGADMKKGGAE